MRFITQKTELQVLKKYSEISELEANTTSKVKQQVDELLSREFSNEKLDYKDLIQVLNKIWVELNEHKSVDELLLSIVDKLLETIRCDACSLYIREKNSQELIFKVARTLSLEKENPNSNKFKNISVPLKKEHVSGYVAITGEVVNISDCYEISEDKEYGFNKTYDINTWYKTTSMLTVPMKLKDGKIIWVLQLINKLGKAWNVINFSEEYENIVSSIASQAAISLENANLFKQIEELCYSLVLALSQAIDARSRHTADHSKRVTEYVRIIVDAINEETTWPFAEVFFTEIQKLEIKYAALLHDAGKISIPESILDKSSKITKDNIKEIFERFQNIKHYLILKKRYDEFNEIKEIFEFINKVNEANYVSDEEIDKLIKISEMKYIDVDWDEKSYITWEELLSLSIQRGNFLLDERRIMERHVIHWMNILNHVKFTQDLKNIPWFAGDHHEKLNWKWYPKWKNGSEISLQARILAVADIFEALTARNRPYKPAMPQRKALAILQEEADKWALDKDLVELFIWKKLYDRYNPNAEDLIY